MGFFSGLFPSSTRTDVSTSVQRVVDDKMLPDSIKRGTITAIIQDGVIPEFVLEECIHSVATSAERMYSYGIDRYAYGNPTAEMYLASQKDDALLEVLKRERRTNSVSIVYSHFGLPNFIHIGWMKLSDIYKYDASTNELVSLTAEKHNKVFLKDMVIVVPSAAEANKYSSTSLAAYGPAPNAGPCPGRSTAASALGALSTASGVTVDPEATELGLLVTYAWEEDESYTPAGATAALTRKVVKTEKMHLSVAGFKDKEHFQVRYTALDKTFFFMYEFGSNSFPLLDDSFKEPTKTKMGKFFPFGYMRYDKRSVHEDIYSDDFKTSNRLFKYLNIDLESLSKTVADNPDAKDVEQAILMMGVPAGSKDQISLRYLFDFFNKLYFSLPVTYTQDVATALNTPLEDPPTTAMSFVIKDKRFKMSLSMFGMKRRRRAGRIGKRGTYASNQQDKGDLVIETGPEDDATGIKPFGNELIYYHQVNDATFDEIHVQSLVLQYHIWNDYHVSAGIGDKNLLVPLDYTITSKYPITYREDLYAKSLHFVFNAVTHTTVEWYESGIFQGILIAIAIVVTIYTGVETVSTVAAMLAAGATVAAVIIYLAFQIVQALIIQALFKLFVRLLGPELAIVLAIVAAVYGVKGAIQAGGLKGAPWAQELLALSSNLSAGITANLKDSFNALQDDARDFQKWAEDQTKLLDKAKDLLDQQTLLSPLIIFGEKPQDFYNRTIHSGNIGVVGIDSVSVYVTSALTLPKLDETLGEFNDVSV